MSATRSPFAFSERSCKADQSASRQPDGAVPERKDVIDGALAAVLARAHVLLLGPPGTAKSALVRCLAQMFGGSYFERLLTKFSTPEELFGPISLQGLAKDRFVRITTGELPEVEFAFVDEIFKWNSAVLNALLSMIDERVFHNDGAPVRYPLVSLFAASNELAESKDLEALFDRFLLRFDVGYVLVAATCAAAWSAPQLRSRRRSP
ncbi:MAG TPA: AAA family ATPase [Kofleriaceae bacterium]|nr:AAA family ATPase [Kofleriaceae bacterium]